jgi:hypothetical protein
MQSMQNLNMSLFCILQKALHIFCVVCIIAYSAYCIAYSAYSNGYVHILHIAIYIFSIFTVIFCIFDCILCIFYYIFFIICPIYCIFISILFIFCFIFCILFVIFCILLLYSAYFFPYSVFISRPFLPDLCSYYLQASQLFNVSTHNAFRWPFSRQP